MAIPTPPQTVIDPFGDSALTRTQISLALANGEVYVFETSKDIYVTAVQDTTTNQYVTPITNNPGGMADGEIQFKQGSNFSASDGLVFDPAQQVLSVYKLDVSSGVNFANTTGNIDLGSIANVKISGGIRGQLLATDGTGNLVFTNDIGASGNAIASGNTTIDVPADNSNIYFTVDNTPNVLVVTQQGIEVANSIVANIVEVAGNVTANNFVGTLSNGTSNISISEGLNIALSAGNVANVVVVTGTGANITGTGNFTGNLSAPNLVGTLANGTSNIAIATDGNITFTTNAVQPFLLTPNNVQLGSNVSLILKANTGSAVRQVEVKASSNSAFTANYTLTLPVNDGNSGQALVTDGTGNLSWANAGGSSSASVTTYAASTTTLADIASTADINYVLPPDTTPVNGDYFFDTRTAVNNTQPVYLYINGNWRQLLTALGY